MLAHNKQVARLCGGGVNRPLFSSLEEEEGEEAEEEEGASLCQPAVCVRGRTGGMLQTYACANHSTDTQVGVPSLISIVKVLMAIRVAGSATCRKP